MNERVNNANKPRPVNKSDAGASRTINIPENLGVEGFIHGLREVLRLPRVQRVVIEVGHLTFFQTVPKDAAEITPNVNVSFDHLRPYNIIRNAPTRELQYPLTLGASAVLTAMLDVTCLSGYTPIAFVVSVNTTLWNWLYFRDDLEVKSRDTLLGYPVLTDTQIPETALVLCVGVDGTTALLDTRLSLKAEMLNAPSVGREEVDVL
jgi:hypothetical protein